MNMNIMNIKTIFHHKCWAAILWLSIAIMMGSCNKNIDNFVPDPGQVIGPDTNWVSNITATMPVALLKNTLLLKPYSDSIDLQKNDTAENTTGLRCSIPANSFLDSMGHLATGKVMIEMLLLTKKGDFIRMDKPTTSDGIVLSSSGAIYVSIVKTGSILIVGQTGRLNLQVYNPLAATLNKLYFGERNINGEFNWLADLPGSRNEIVPNNFGYEIKTNRLNWMTASTPLESIAFTNITLSLPAQYTNANTAAYLVYRDSKSVVNLYGNAGIKKFGSTNVPGGKAATIVVLSRQGNDYYAASQSVTTSANSGGAVNQLVTVLPTKITFDAMQQLLNAL
jgi:hypothetical protein